MNAFSSAIALLLASTVAAKSAQDIIARPHIAKLIVGADVTNQDDDDDYACYPELFALMECVGTECVDCIIDLVEDLDESTTCADLEAGTFCTDLVTCLTGSCAVNDCTAPANAIESCEAENHPEPDSDDCPGLCEEGGGPAADAKRLRGILVPAPQEA